MKQVFCLIVVLLWSGAALAESEAVGELNELLRGELSAVDTYKQALEKVGTEPEAEILRGVLRDHDEAVVALKAYVDKLGGTPAQSSGTWGAFAKAVTGTAKVFGNAAALKALKEGEEHGLKEHRELLNDEDVPADIRAQIGSTFVAKQEGHIQTLSRLIERQ